MLNARGVLIVLMFAVCGCSGCGRSERPQVVEKPPESAKPAKSTDLQSAPTSEPSPTTVDTDEENAAEQDEAAAENQDLPARDDPAESDSQQQAEVGQPDEPAEGVVKRVLLYAKGGPLVIEFAITIDGRSAARITDELVKQLLIAADSDGDGKPTWEEAVESRRFAFDEFAGGASGDRAERIRRYDRNRDGIVDRAEVWRLVSHGDEAGIAFRLARSDAMGGMAAAMADVKHLLDVDGNGWLSAEEIADSPARLKLGDIDDDDLIRYQELQSINFAAGQNNPRPAVSRKSSPAAILDGQTNWGVIYYDLEERYLYGGQLDADCFPLVPELVKSLDQDENGAFDRNEVDGLLEIVPHFRLSVDFGTSDDGAAKLNVVSIDDQLGLGEHAIGPYGAGVRIELPGTALELSAVDTSGANSYAAGAREQFTQLDADKNGYLEAEEVPEDQSPDEFADWDSDDDGKVFAEELIAAFRRKQAPILNRIEATVQESEHSLFATLDSSRDGQLSLREMRDAAVRFARLDRNGDGRLSRGEIPGRLTLLLRRGQSTGQPAATAAGAPVSVQSPASPPWFVRMDSNGDLDVSPREFLGPTAAFGRLDGDGDGLISAAEAAAVEKVDDSASP